jgi:multiple sugar transport system permease protein
MSRTWKKYRMAYLFILPTVVAMTFVHFVPTMMAIYMSFLKLNQFTLGKFLHAPFVGLHNYRTIFGGAAGNALVAGIQYAARNTVLYSIAVNAGTIGVGMVLAMLLNREFKGRGIARTLMLLPWVVPTYVVGLLWGMMWLRDQGIINVILVDWLHLFHTKPFWLLGRNTLIAIIVPTIWRQLPFNTIMLLSGLQLVPQELYDAASIDGASGWKRFVYVTIPVMKPVLAIIILWGTIFTMFGYNIVVMMFGNGGGYPGEWGDLLMPAIQRQSFGYWMFGLGSAVSVLMMLGMMVFVWLWYRAFKVSLIQE